MVNHYSCSTYVYNQAKFNETRFILQITLFFDVHLIEMGVTVEREKKKHGLLIRLCGYQILVLLIVFVVLPSAVN